MTPRRQLLAGLVVLLALAGRLIPPLTAVGAMVALVALAWGLTRPGTGAQRPGAVDPGDRDTRPGHGSGRPLLIALTIGLAGAWLAMRPPWEPWAGTLLWAGGLWIAVRPQPGTWGDLQGILVGAVSGVLVGALATRGLPADAGGVAIQVLAVLVMVVIGRLAVAQVAARTGALAGVLLALAVTVPLATGRWGLAAVVTEGLAAAVALASDDEATAWGWVAGGIAAGLGVIVAPMLPALF